MISPEPDLVSPLNDANCSNVQNVSFTELMETPKIKKKRVCRRKSLNYKAQIVTKNLFYGTNKVKSGKDTSGKSDCPRKTKIIPRRNCRPMATKNASWFCAVCGKDTALSMRQCYMCKIWYHEECVGLESDDEDNFFCMECY